MRRSLALLVLLLGCPSTTPPPETTPEPEPEPEIALDGQVLYDAPLADAPPTVLASWETFRESWASEPPMPPEDPGPQAYQSFATERFAPYVERQVGAASELLDGWEAAANPREKLVHAVLAARLLHRSASWMWTLPMPDVADVNPAALASLEQSIRGAAKNFAQYAHSAFGKCVEAAGDTPAFEPWRTDCVRRAEALEPILTAQIGPPPPTPMPEGCEDHSDPVFASPQHDPEARPELLVLVEAESDAVDEAEVQSAVERWARSEHGLRAVPAGRRRAAERLVASSKLSPRGPECTSAPSLTWVLGARVPHLVVARVDQSCHEARPVDGHARVVGESETFCELILSWRRAGSRDGEGLPPLLRRDLPDQPTTEAVIESLSAPPPGDAAILGTLGGGGGSPARVSVAGVQTDPGYRLVTAIETLEVGECQAERGASRLQLAWTVTPTGAVESVTVEGGDDAVNTCVRQKLEELALTCTPSGEPIEMQTTLCLAR